MFCVFVFVDFNEIKLICLQKFFVNSWIWGVYVYFEEGDLILGIIFGDDNVMVIDVCVMFVFVQDVVECVCQIIDKLICYVLFMYYYVVCVFGVVVFEGVEIIVSVVMCDFIVECGKQDWKFEVQCFLRFFCGFDLIFGLIWLMIIFEESLMFYFGKFEVQLFYFGVGYIVGDMVVWLLKQKIFFVGDLVENGVMFYLGDVYFGVWLCIFK